jgi:hypothetical protein
VEIPVTTLPLLRTPIHLSYVLYIATVSPSAALAYFRTALLACRVAGVEPSILLHPLDFLTGSDCEELQFFPGMGLDPGVKRRVLLKSLRFLKDGFDVLPLSETLGREPIVPAGRYVENSLSG